MRLAFAETTAWLVIAWLIQTAPQCVADELPKSFHSRVSDMLTLTDGTRLRGIATSRKPPALIVRTDWLKANAASLLEGELNKQLQNGAAALDSLNARIELEIARLNDAPRKNEPRVALLREILANRQQPGELPEFLLLEIPAARVRRFDLQSEKTRRVARLAAVNGITRFEDLSAESVEAALEKLGNQLQSEIPQPAAQDPELELRLLLAAVDVELGAVSRLVVQGTTVLDESKAADPNALMQQFLGDGLQQALNDILQGQGQGQAQPAAESLPPAARRIADQAGMNTLILSSSEFDLASGTAQVSRRLFTKSSAGDWMTSPILVSTSQATIDDLKPGEADAVAGDPQVKQITDAVAAFGVGAEQVSTAISMGAVVQAAARRADEDFKSRLMQVTDSSSTGLTAPVRLQLAPQ